MPSKIDETSTSVSESWGFETTADEVANTLREHIAGKTILITGVSPSGLGSTAALSIARASPALLILASRTLASTATTIAAIADLHLNVPIRTLTLDLASLSSVRAAAAELLADATVPALDVLICNAGVFGIPYDTTADGFERQFGTNYIGHFVFTNLLLRGGGLKPDTGRVVSVSSVGHQNTNIRYDDIGFSSGESYDTLLAYGQSKTANMLFAVELARRGVRAYSLHPGTIVETQGWRPCPEEIVREILQYMPGKTLQQGAATHLVAAFDPRLDRQSGAYLDDCKVAKSVKPYALDPENAKRLWRVAEEMVGEVFDI